ncbi:hypothetical protein N7G274_004734 [Stereocaulon virgatum]|uniref:Myb-like domain-containing protein n=1 Tax=Stereocaulon virgatum TaxID=373712 RepID=A0ABR4ABL4_9LECA
MSPNGSKDNPVVNYSGHSSSSGAPNHHRQVSSRNESVDRSSSARRARDTIDLTGQIAVAAPWTKEEDERLKSLVRQGADWDDCAAHLPGRSNVSCHEHFEELWQRWLSPLLRWCRIEKQRQIEIVNKAARSSKPSATPMQDPPSHPDQTPGDAPRPGPLEATLLKSPVHPGLRKPPKQYPRGCQK